MEQDEKQFVSVKPVTIFQIKGHSQAIDSSTAEWLWRQASIEDGWPDLLKRHQDELFFDFERGCLTRKAWGVAVYFNDVQTEWYGRYYTEAEARQLVTNLSNWPPNHLFEAYFSAERRED